ncbi:VOC family protein [Roseibacillus persicicus]|uniref:VOC family protein n=1 Tax=Roseibacillus persicicus TaxID=454148 RepID=A0A918TU24_9BACT|nr:VOC family protein [Roseibacillus persicicus]GHC62618.1 VOC family protein [Roseibacillus persicicus]
MKTIIEPYLFFDGCCEEAIEFYVANLGAEVEMMMRFKDCPDPLPPGMDSEENADKVMHATLKIGENKVMASDSCCGESEEKVQFAGFSLSLAFESEADAREAFAKLADGGEVAMPLGETFWSPCFGMVTDRFGLQWMITVQEVKA